MRLLLLLTVTVWRMMSIPGTRSPFGVRTPDTRSVSVADVGFRRTWHTDIDRSVEDDVLDNVSSAIIDLA
jgi:hypothetical protein